MRTVAMLFAVSFANCHFDSFIFFKLLLILERFTVLHSTLLVFTCSNVNYVYKKNILCVFSFKT